MKEGAKIFSRVLRRFCRYEYVYGIVYARYIFLNGNGLDRDPKVLKSINSGSKLFPEVLAKYKLK
jgi:hypothetical protein